MKICEAVREAGGRAMLVGGSVRDYLLGLEAAGAEGADQPKDFDIEVYRIEPDRLRAILETLAPVNTVGEHFSVYKLVFYRKSESSGRFEIDVSIPRRESKSGRGHRGFIVTGDPMMTFEEAARRRDFTVNAILLDPLTGEMVDPTGGAEDLKRRVLRAVAADTFVEDSLRVLRAVQLAARFEMTVDPRTAELCRTIELSDLPRERVWGEWEKLLLSAGRPSTGLQVALDLGVLDKLFPSIRALAGFVPPGVSHPPGDLFNHVKRSVDSAAKLVGDLPQNKRITVMLATLSKDLGEPLEGDASSAQDRSELAARQTRLVLDALGLHTLSGYDARSQVLALVREQRRPAEFYKNRDRVSDGDFRRLAQKVDLSLLALVARADLMAAGADNQSAADWFIEKARALGVDQGPPAPLLQGRHLLGAGFAPGPRMGEILRAVYELQLDGEITTPDQAMAAARRLGRSPGADRNI